MINFRIHFCRSSWKTLSIEDGQHNCQKKWQKMFYKTLQDWDRCL